MFFSDRRGWWTQRKKSGNFFWVRILPLDSGFFLFFQHFVKVLILFQKFIHEYSIERKKWAHHEKNDGKYFETVNLYFRVPKLLHRDFSPQMANTIKIWRFSDHIVSTSSTTNLMGKTNLHYPMNASKTFMTLLRDSLFKI